MAIGGALSRALAAVKGHATVATIAGMVLLAGGTAAAAVATGMVKGPSQQSNAQHGQNAQHNQHDQTSDRAAACANNGEAQRLAAIYAPMFGSAHKAQDSICAIFVNKGSNHAIGFGEIRQALDIAAAIETHHSSTACLTAASNHASSGDTDPAPTPNNASHGGNGNHASNGTIPRASSDTTNALLKTILDASGPDMSLAQLAQSCGVSHDGS